MSLYYAGLSNRPAFWSFGKEQTVNASLCFTCASGAVDALDYMVRAEQHRRALISDPKRSGLRNQLAIFWLRKRLEIPSNGRTYDLEALLGALLEDVPGRAGPPPSLSQLEALLSVPWSPHEAALHLGDTHFYLAVLSANKARLVVREWLDVSLQRLRQNLESYLRALRIVMAWGEGIKAFSIPMLLGALGAEDPNLTRGLLRTAYGGFPPPGELLEQAVRRFRTSAVQEDQREAWRLQILVGVMKLGLTYGKEEAKAMEQLDLKRSSRAYLCGRLLAVLEEAQLRASGFNLNKTIVGRFYGAASTAPAARFGGLIRLATTAHLPEVGREVNVVMEEVVSRLDEAGGFPKTLTLAEQAEFALGFYHQRAAFRAGRGKSKEAKEGGES